MAGSFSASYDLYQINLKLNLLLDLELALLSFGGGNMIGTEFNLNLLYKLKVFMDLELHAAYLSLGDFYDSPVVNGGLNERPTRSMGTICFT